MTRVVLRDRGGCCITLINFSHVFDVGTYSNLTGLASESECILCPGGYYCQDSGLTEPSGLCGEGYFCPEGSTEQQPAANFCPVGNFCPEGVAAALPCRNLTYVSSYGETLYACDVSNVLGNLSLYMHLCSNSLHSFTGTNINQLYTNQKARKSYTVYCKHTQYINSIYMYSGPCLKDTSKKDVSSC